MIVNFLSGSKVYIVEPLTVLRNTNMDLNFTFTVGWGWVGAAASYLEEQRPVIWRSSGKLSGGWVAGLFNTNANLSKAELAAGRC